MTGGAGRGPYPDFLVGGGMAGVSRGAGCAGGVAATVPAAVLTVLVRAGLRRQVDDAPHECLKDRAEAGRVGRSSRLMVSAGLATALG